MSSACTNARRSETGRGAGHTPRQARVKDSSVTAPPRATPARRAREHTHVALERGVQASAYRQRAGTRRGVRAAAQRAQAGRCPPTRAWRTGTARSAAAGARTRLSQSRARTGEGFARTSSFRLRPATHSAVGSKPRRLAYEVRAVGGARRLPPLLRGAVRNIVVRVEVGYPHGGGVEAAAARVRGSRRWKIRPRCRSGRTWHHR
jgi:hypothetical protein